MSGPAPELDQVLAERAAPLPDAERDRIAVERAFGTWADRAGGASFRAVPGGVCVRAPANRFRFRTARIPGIYGAPALLQTVDDDFTAVVRVSSPGDVWHRAGPLNTLAAGLHAENDFGYRAGIHYSLVARDDRRPTCRSFSVLLNQGGAVGEDTPAADHNFLRLTRVGQLVAFATSSDGVVWQARGEVTFFGLAGRVRVGVTVENTLDLPVEVTFDRYSLTQPRKGATP